MVNILENDTKEVCDKYKKPYKNKIEKNKVESILRTNNITRKLMASIVFVILIIALAPIRVHAEWKKSGNSWYYMYENDYAKSWKQIDGKWYYFSEDGDNKMMADIQQYIDGAMYSFDKTGEMQTGWIQTPNNWNYFYSNGKMAENTVIDGYIIGSSGGWDRNPEYTANQALKIVEKKYADQPDILVSVSDNFGYEDEAKYFMIHLASKSYQAMGGTGTIGYYKVYVNGAIEE